MKTTNLFKPKFAVLKPALLVAAILSFATVSSILAGGRGNSGNPGILPAHSQPYGKSYGEWAANWWQWALSVPADRNPLTDTTGEFAGENQNGPVWFAPGTLGGSAERSYTVPAGKAVFVPVFTWLFGAAVFDCEPTVPGVPCVVCDLQELAASNTEKAEVLSVTIDGVPVKDVSQYRATPPGPFSIVYPENSIVGEPAGTYFPQVADGYWLMLAPLSKGTHEVVVHVRAPDTIFGWLEFDVIHHITVASHAQQQDRDGCFHKSGARHGR